MRHLWTAAAMSIALAGCGTGVYRHQIEVAVNDPSKRLGAAPAEVAVFEHHQSGITEDWARRTIGKATPGAPYTGESSATDVKMVYDMSPPASVRAGVFVPGVEPDGYFILNINPVEGLEQATTLPYYSFYAPRASDDKILPLAARFTGRSARKGWTIKLTVDVPPAAAKP
jgi:hypothetical protein